MFLQIFFFNNISQTFFCAETSKKTKPFGRTTLLYKMFGRTPILSYFLFCYVPFHIFNNKDNGITRVHDNVFVQWTEKC
jgi:hypothetical protein